MKKEWIETEDVLNWHGSDHDIEELAEYLAGIINGEISIETAYSDVMSCKEEEEEEDSFYYEVHVVEGLHDGFGVPIKSDTELDDGEAIQLAIDSGKITEDDVVDYVEPLTREEYEESIPEE